MVDLSALFAIGQGLADQAITTSGTTITFTTPGTVTTDPDTLETTTTPGIPTSSEAIVAPVTGGTSQLLPGVDVRVGDWRIVLPPTVADPSPLVDVVVIACRDAQMVARHATVLGCSRSSAGAVLTVYARPVTP